MLYDALAGDLLCLESPSPLRLAANGRLAVKVGPNQGELSRGQAHHASAARQGFFWGATGARLFHLHGTYRQFAESCSCL